MLAAPVEVIVISDDEDCKDELDVDATHKPEGGADETRRGRVPESLGLHVECLYHSDGTRFADIAKREHEIDGLIACNSDILTVGVDARERLPSSSHNPTPFSACGPDLRPNFIPTALVSLEKLRVRSLNPEGAMPSTYEDSFKYNARQAFAQLTSTTRDTSTTLYSQPRGSSADPIINSSPLMLKADEVSERCPSRSSVETGAFLPRANEGTRSTSSTPSEMEVDQLIQSARDDESEFEENMPPSPIPASQPQRASAPYVIPPDVPWRRPQHEARQNASLVEWARPYALSRITPSIPESSTTIRSLHTEVAHGRPVVNGLSGHCWRTISDPGEGFLQSTRLDEVYAPPDQGQDPVARFLQDFGLSPTLANNLRAVGINDEHRMRALGRLHGNVLNKLDKVLKQAGFDPTAILLIKEGLRRRARQG